MALGLRLPAKTVQSVSVLDYEGFLQFILKNKPAEAFQLPFP